MKVVVMGANGQIGQHLVQLLKESEKHTVTAMVRSPVQATALKEKGVDSVVADLEGSVEELTNAIAESDAIVFTAGSGGKTGPDKTLLIDLDGAVKSMEAAEKAGVQRFIMVSALQAHNRTNWHETIRPYYVAKHYADRMLESTNLNYTIIRPGGLTNEPSTGKIKISNYIDGGVIPREDVASVILHSLDLDSTYRKAFDLTGGETPIYEALRDIRLS